MMSLIFTNNALHILLLPSKEDVREAGKKGLIPPITSEEEVNVAMATQPPSFPDMVGYLHKRVSYVCVCVCVLVKALP